jgi:hypothetical protein
MDLDCELEIFDNKTLSPLIKGYRGTIDLPYELYDTKVVHFVPGIVTKIWVSMED